MAERRKLNKNTPLTDRQQQVVEAIRAFWTSHGYGPSFRDLCHILGISSLNGIKCHMVSLQARGIVSLDSGIARSIRVVDDYSDWKSVVGKLADAVGSVLQVQPHSNSNTSCPFCCEYHGDHADDCEGLAVLELADKLLGRWSDVA